MEEFKKKSRPSFGTGRPQKKTEHKSFRSREDGEKRPFRSREDGDRKPFRSREDGEHRSFRSREDGERRPFRSREDGERRSFRSREDGDRKPFRSREGGERRPFRSNKPFGSRKNNSGIERMISRKPQVSTMTAPKEVEVIAKDEVRLNKFIANSGICSRREADQMIQAGVVSVNGTVVTELGTKVNIFNDEVRFNGELLRGESKVYIVMNKPKGYVTTASDPHADKTVMDLLKNCTSRVFPVGRLDKNTTGVLMFTNDGDVAEKLAHPSYDKKKIYQVTLDRNLSREDYDSILAGIELADGPIQADELEYIDEDNHRKLGIEIHSGKNRIVRRIFESLGYEVKGLDRVYFAGLTKKGLKRGEWRFLTENEANILKMGAYL